MGETWWLEEALKETGRVGSEENQEAGHNGRGRGTVSGVVGEGRMRKVE